MRLLESSYSSLGAGLLLLSLLLSTTSTANAQAPAASMMRLTAPKLDFQRARRELRMDSRQRVRNALDVMVLLAEPRVAAPVAARLRQGLPPDLAALAIEALAASGSPRAVSALQEQLQHRRASIRRQAVEALGRLRARSAFPQVVGSLQDPDESVRGAALVALGLLGDRRALKPLYAALDAGRPQAALAIGRLARATDIDRLLRYATERPFAALHPAIDTMIHRSDLQAGTKLKLIAALGKLGTAPAQDYLRGLLKQLPQAHRKQWMRAIGQAMRVARDRHVVRIQAPRQGPAVDAQALAVRGSKR